MGTPFVGKSYFPFGLSLMKYLNTLFLFLQHLVQKWGMSYDSRLCYGKFLIYIILNLKMMLNKVWVGTISFLEESYKIRRYSVLKTYRNTVLFIIERYFYILNILNENTSLLTRFSSLTHVHLQRLDISFISWMICTRLIIVWKLSPQAHTKYYAA